MRFAIYHREREYAHEMGDPKLAQVDAPTQEEAEHITAHLGSTGTLAVPITPAPDQPPAQAGAVFSLTVHNPTGTAKARKSPFGLCT